MAGAAADKGTRVRRVGPTARRMRPFISQKIRLFVTKRIVPICKCWPT